MKPAGVKKAMAMMKPMIASHIGIKRRPSTAARDVAKTRVANPMTIGRKKSDQTALSV